MTAPAVLSASWVDRRNYISLILLFVLSIALWWHPLAATFRVALNSDAHTHILLILPLSLALTYVDRSKLSAPVRRNGRDRLMVTAATTISFALVRFGGRGLPADVQLFVSVFALVFAWIGIFLFAFGARALRTSAFPLCFLFWLVPIPSSAVNVVVDFLQRESTFATRVLFELARVPVTQDGTLLSIPDLDIEVAPECSSIRSSLMLVITTMVLAHLFLRTWWRKALLIATAIPLSVAKNGLRIFTIAELGTRVDAGYLDGRLHHQGGAIFLGIAMITVVVLLLVLRKTEMARSADSCLAV